MTTTTPNTAHLPGPTTSKPWWASAAYYQVYVRSFADSNGDGIGDLAGVRSQIGHIASLGVDAIWLTPFYPSPGFDHGYDVADYCDVDPKLGNLAELDGLVADAHNLGLRVIVDLVPNHSSSEHEWFRNAMADPRHPDRQRYLLAPADPGGGPPNNWTSVFGGSAWSRVPAPVATNEESWYLHLFAPEQPDLNWRSPVVVDEFDEILRFWLDRDVDGFRIDVAHGLFKDSSLRDNPVVEDEIRGGMHTRMVQAHTFDQEEVHDVYRRWRALVDSYSGDRVLVGEVFLWEPDRVARYVRPDELHLAFNFLLLGQRWNHADIRRAIALTLDALSVVGATPTWVLSNHDVARHVTRYGGGDLGRQRSRAALLGVLALPGAVFLYQGEELGLEEVELPPAARQDPVHRNGGDRPGRDGCRVPLPWTADRAAGHGFTSGEPWLPWPDGWGRSAVATQNDDATSMLAHYRDALAARRRLSVLIAGSFTWLDGPDECLVFERSSDDTRLTCAVNLSEATVSLNAPGTLTLASNPNVTHANDQVRLAPGTAAWIIRAI